jgi:GH15 family glucan-1,4-alpha-glucosidase
MDWTMNTTNEAVSFEPGGWTIAYPDIRQHGLIGDRRTAALVAADGTLDWLCLPDFDGRIVLGALLDWGKGGHWRIGPRQRMFGGQSYAGESMVLETRWELPEGTLILEDAMLWPESKRPEGRESARLIVRRLRCMRGQVRCDMDLRIHANFQAVDAAFTEQNGAFALSLPELNLRLQTSRPPVVIGARVHVGFDLREGDDFWSVLEAGPSDQAWSSEAVEKSFAQARQYWADWLRGIRPLGGGQEEIRRTAMVVHLLTFAPEGSVVAAPTTSVPERIGGGWNVDYRLCWVRDASLSVGTLARLGNLEEAEQYLSWLAKRVARFGKPLRVLYEIRGGTRPVQRKLSGVAGYRQSAPVRVGNHAYKQHQLGSYGFLADCLWTCLAEGGAWHDEYWMLLERIANYTVRHWQDPENGIWELPERRHYISSKVLSWVALERAMRIARQFKPAYDLATWQSTAEAIHAEVMDKGWSERLGSFRQHYDAETLDASCLLISILDFLPGDHPHVLGTIERISQHLAIDRFVYRFDPLQTPGLGQLPLGELEGAFFPSTFWLATAYAKAGQVGRAEAILEKVEQLAGPTQLFSEAIDARSGNYLGNVPLLFSHVEYVRAKLEINRVRGQKQPGTD